MRNWRNTDPSDLKEEVDGIMRYEQWNDVEGYEMRYKVSDFGRVKSFVVSDKGRIRKGVTALGYPQVQLKGNGDGTWETKKIHRLVAIHFIPNPDNLPEVNHKFGDRGDCRVWMIEWSTASDNVKHAYRVLGKKVNLDNKGEKHHRAKFKEADILNIRQSFSEGVHTKKELADMYGVGKLAIHKIVLRQRWTHI